MALDLFSGLNAVYQISDVERVVGKDTFEQIRQGKASLEGGAEFDDHVVIMKCHDAFSVDDAITHFSGFYGSNMVLVDCGRRPSSCPDWLDAEFGNLMDWYQVRHIKDRDT